MTDDLQITSGKAHRARIAEGVVLRLPSGLVARVRSVSPDTVLRLGKFPDQLTPVVAEILERNMGEGYTPQTLEQLEANFEFINVVCRTAMMEPRIVDNPKKDDEIGIEHLEWPDREFLVGTLGVTTRQLELFREQQMGHVEPVDTTAGHEDASE